MSGMALNATVISLLLTGMPAAAQEPATATRYIDPVAGLTIAQAIDQGLRQEPGLRETRTAIGAARGERRQAALRPNPMVSAERREEVGGGDNQTMIGVELPLDLFRRGARVEAADRTIAVTERAAEDRERLLAAEIRDRIGIVLAAARRLDVLDALVEASRRTVELLDARVREGAAPPIDRDVATVELQRLRANRELAIGQADAAVAELKPLLGVAPESALKLRNSLEASATGDSAESDAAPTTRRADVLEAEAQVAAAEARVVQVRQEAKPDIGVFASYMRMDAGFPQLAFGSSGALQPIHAIFHNAAGGVRVTVPVFNRSQGALAAARARSESAAYNLEARRLTAGAEVAAARARDAAARRALTGYSSEARKMALRNLDVFRETYQLGRATLLDVLNEQRRYLDFETGYTDALAEAYAARAALQRATGVVR
ncbi:MAG TPA: TolC family protein [Vicinamibacterales bacterium]|nr:TolC family protein [Vicinamibacterales bacterium]